MLTLFHTPNSRSTRIIALLNEMGIADKVKIQNVTIPRQDGTGRRDPANPHPEGKVPALAHNGALITETAAIINYLTEMFPDTGFAPTKGDPQYGPYLTWLHWYGAVMEPVLICAAAEISHPYLTASIRGVPEINARLSAALKDRPYLLGDTYSAADLLIHSPYAWFGTTVDDPKVQDWVKRCMARPSRALSQEFDEKLKAA